MTISRWPLFHIVSDESKRVLLRARGPGELPELSQGEAVRAWDWERPREIEKIMRMPPVGPARRSA
jgi:hypothetical protein